MKFSISLSGPASKRVQGWAINGGRNISTVIEAALWAFARLSDDERQREFDRVIDSKQARTRSGWINLFWESLAAEYRTEDPLHLDLHRVYTERVYDGYRLAFLLKTGDPTEAEVSPADFIIGATKIESPDVELPTGYTFVFDRNDLPIEAAQRVKAWIDKFGRLRMHP